MRISVAIAATVIGGIAFNTLGGALHADSGKSPRWLAPVQWHRLLRKTGRELCSWTTVAWNFGRRNFISAGHTSIIRSFELSLKEFTLNSYQNRPWHELVRRP